MPLPVNGRSRFILFDYNKIFARPRNKEFSYGGGDQFPVGSETRAYSFEGQRGLWASDANSDNRASCVMSALVRYRADSTLFGRLGLSRTVNADQRKGASLADE